MTGYLHFLSDNAVGLQTQPNDCHNISSICSVFELTIKLITLSFVN